MLCETFLQPFMYQPKMGLVKARMLGERSKIFLFSKTVKDYGNRLAEICLVWRSVGQAGHSLSMRWLQSLWFRTVRTFLVRTFLVAPTFFFNCCRHLDRTTNSYSKSIFCFRRKNKLNYFFLDFGCVGDRWPVL